MIYREEQEDLIKCENELDYADAIGQHALLCRNPQFAAKAVEGGAIIKCERCKHQISYVPRIPEGVNEWKQKFDNFLDRYRKK